MKGDFEFSGSGTFSTGSGSRGAVLIAAAVIAVLVIEWVTAHIWWILGGTGVLAVAVILALRWLVRRQQRREAAYGEQRAAIRCASAGEIPATASRTLPPVHLHFHGMTPGEAAEVVRRQIGQ